MAVNEPDSGSYADGKSEEGVDRSFERDGVLRCTWAIEVLLGGLGGRAEGAQVMAVGVELHGESYGLLIDSIGEVLKLPEADREPNPLNLDPKLAAVSAGIYRLETQLLVIVDVDRVLDTGAMPAAA